MRKSIIVLIENMAKNAKKFEERKWGTFDVLGEFKTDYEFSKTKGKDVVIKKIVVQPDQMLSYQSHDHRREIWIVVQGIGIVVKNELEKTLSVGDVIKIGVRDKHRIINRNHEVPLIFVEISTGKFDEKDIIRYENKYGRK